MDASVQARSPFPASISATSCHAQPSIDKQRQRCCFDAAASTLLLPQLREITTEASNVTLAGCIAELIESVNGTEACAVVSTTLQLTNKLRDAVSAAVTRTQSKDGARRAH
uniref:Uncharacterized protein n=1 Tax=Peronospora matthiolae TaxID=2874970 RepID=A0AAV1UTY2_9STRA